MRGHAPQSELNWVRGFLPSCVLASRASRVTLGLSTGTSGRLIDCFPHMGHSPIVFLSCMGVCCTIKANGRQLGHGSGLVCSIWGVAAIEWLASPSTDPDLIATRAPPQTNADDVMMPVGSDIAPMTCGGDLVGTLGLDTPFGPNPGETGGAPWAGGRVNPAVRSSGCSISRRVLRVGLLRIVHDTLPPELGPGQ